ncbi:MAG TPA: BON domain-containing protein [Paraburkholderia sp.]|jgi:hyperosmotically inducible protein|nr:BON domain-containing protein [Paraburkholderia sp.]
MKFTQFCGIAIAAAALATIPTLAQADNDAAATSAPAVKKTSHSQNLKTERTIRKALTRTKGLDASNILVVIRHGAISLDGSVPEASQIQLAQNAAEQVSQGLTVNNHLSVIKPPTQ